MKETISIASGKTLPPNTSATLVSRTQLNWEINFINIIAIELNMRSDAVSVKLAKVTKFHGCLKNLPDLEESSLALN